MKNKSVTLSDIAKELGVSANAVSLALRGKDGVSDALRERIVKKAREMNYVGMNQLQGCILALIPQRIEPAHGSGFYTQLCFQMEAYAASLGYQLIISSVQPADEEALRVPPLLNTIPCAGIITVGNMTREYCKMIQRLGLPYVMADQYYDDVPASSVVTANTSGSYLLTSHLIEKGHTKIQFFGMAFRTSSLEDRWIGYKRAMLQHGLQPLDNQLLRPAGPMSNEGVLLPQALDALPELPTAFVCGHDATARTVIEILHGRGLRCPDDVSVVGFDDIQSPDLLALQLTTYNTPKKAIAETAVDLVLESDARCPQRIQLYGDVVYRGSVKDIR
ncbi:MAG: LacI family DNA-binding transcriptional regulator [Clostridia bacterium]|nr:LacI family DNA-binding transcriptional regulator [Clostridia bacterium]